MIKLSQNVFAPNTILTFECVNLGQLNENVQKIHISWTPSKVLPEYFNVTVESDDKNFFAKKTIPGVSITIQIHSFQFL